MGKGTAALMVLAFFIASCIIAAKPVLSSAELIEDSWVSKEPLLTARSDLGAAVVNGKIYAIGGMPDYNTNEEYDPATDMWNVKAPMPTARYKFGIAVYQNKIYCIGGQFSNRSSNARSEQTGAIEVYDPATNTWEIKTPMPSPRSQFQANVVNGKIYLIGGRTGGQYSTVSLNEVYNPETEAWTTKASIPYPVVSYASAVVGNKIYVLGGQDEFNETMNLAVNQIYDTETDTWSFGTPMPTAVWKTAGAKLGAFAQQRIFVVGGELGNIGGAANITQIYDPEADTWSGGSFMPTSRFGLACVVVNDKLYAIGGTEHNILPGEEANAENEMYIPIGHGTDTEGDAKKTETFPVVLVVAAASITIVVIVSGGLLVYLQRKHLQSRL